MISFGLGVIMFVYNARSRIHVIGTKNPWSSGTVAPVVLRTISERTSYGNYFHGVSILFSNLH